ncbi:hypothetical protein ACHAQA_002849 [Verticillium albo-atrum]
MSSSIRGTRFCLAYLTCFLCVSTGVESRLTVPGVAFALNPDYGTAAIYFANRTHVEVAQIEGSQLYKPIWHKSGDEEAWIGKLPGSTLLGRVLCPVLPSVSPALCSRRTDLSSVEDLLRSLQASVVSTLGTKFCFADVVLPQPGLLYQKRIIQDAVKSIGLRQALVVVDSARAAITANGIGTPSHDLRPQQLILSVDYSASELNVVLFSELSGIIDPERKFYIPQLGDAHRSRADHAAALEDVLREATKPPFGKGSFGKQLPNEIRHLVLHGDAVLGSSFLDILRRVIGDTLVKDAHSFSPVFAGAVGMAQLSQGRMEDIDFDVPPAFGCRWRSSLYDADRQDL